MKSPVPDQSPTDGEKVSDSTPLLPGSPQAEAGERRSDPGASGGRLSRCQGGCPGAGVAGLPAPPGLWGQSCLDRGSGGA